MEAGDALAIMVPGKHSVDRLQIQAVVAFMGSTHCRRWQE